MKPLIANRLFRWFTAAGLAVASTSAVAQIWPGGQPLRVIVPFPGGASTLDSVVRTLAPEMSRALGVPVIVDNRPGAGTVIGSMPPPRPPMDARSAPSPTVSRSTRRW